MQRCVLAAAVLFFSELAWPPASAQKTPSLAKHIAPVDISLALRERVDLREFDLEYDDPSTEVQAKGIPVRDRGSVRATTGVRYPAMPHAVASDSPLQPTSYFARLREEFLSTPCDGPGRCLPHVMGGGTEHSGSKTIETTGSTGHKRHKRKKILLDPRLASVQTELKVAFLFLTRGPMPLERLWMRFFDDAKEKNQGHLYSVYLHAAPGYQYNESTTPCVDFWHREIPHSRSVEWGMMSVVDAERSLLLHALAEDALNQWFVLLSESCIPLRSLDSIREHLLASPVSFVDSFNDVQGRYHPSMAPVVQKRHWRKGGQWFAMCRRHALMVVEDTEVYAEFNKWCQVDWNEDHSHWRFFCAGDEHYIQTLLHRAKEGAFIERHSLTFANWWPVTRSHPKRYVVQESSKKLISKLRRQHSYTRPLEKDSLTCHTWTPLFEYLQEDTIEKVDMLHGGKNSTLTLSITPRDQQLKYEKRNGPCWMFARKFSPKAVDRIMLFNAKFLGF